MTMILNSKEQQCLLETSQRSSQWACLPDSEPSPRMTRTCWNSTMDWIPKILQKRKFPRLKRSFSKRLDHQRRPTRMNKAPGKAQEKERIDVKEGNSSNNNRFSNTFRSQWICSNSVKLLTLLMVAEWESTVTRFEQMRKSMISQNLALKQWDS